MGVRTDTKRRMLLSSIELLRERGAGGVTVEAVLSRSQSPRGSVYHHFPGGRSEILSEALTLAGDTIADIVEQSAARGSGFALRRIGKFWRKVLLDSDFSAGCPVVSVAVGASPDEQHLQPTVAATFQRLHQALVGAIVVDGVNEQRADRLATMALAAIEGAIILCRVQRSTTPLDDVITEFEALITSAAG
ncbi:TetR/AcrR family transcriptional regulator [Mycobacterium shimoidei]|uniref:TetR family transcriptional regulator [Amycolicicoccus subflavus DQS3-9A1] n=1 Tax=Mycobacterium shimoidei TaxID=29313 RepID=A0A375YYL4_MYCSH|nr:TetR/AcrR family transcriptional regulator [Mycobacterium shimoidei]MCV7259675.1 TetR/AcrR family transcriptional regulator [Mycobacterium shimoidei]ORW76634.1 TetR family transcriptional regulator [Mycobacterium shimoidei]SRX93942.1 TetR family transcriptional regulator [Amycolicicoccus subflavus DQS3-9A1] [Mycobacterium shimoidei]